MIWTYLYTGKPALTFFSLLLFTCKISNLIKNEIVKIVVNKMAYISIEYKAIVALWVS